MSKCKGISLPAAAGNISLKFIGRGKGFKECNRKKPKMIRKSKRMVIPPPQLESADQAAMIRMRNRIADSMM